MSPDLVLGSGVFGFWVLGSRIPDLPLPAAGGSFIIDPDVPADLAVIVSQSRARSAPHQQKPMARARIRAMTRTSARARALAKGT